VSQRGSAAGAAREATAAELAAWDHLTVDVPGGQVLQSMAWARHRAGSGWEPHHLVCPDGRGVLALTRPFRIIGGARAYLPRGPVTAGDAPEQVAARVEAVTGWLGARGVDVVITDAELPAATDHAARLKSLGFHPVEEIQPARHRMSIRLDGASEDAVHGGVSKQTRQRIRQAEEGGVQIRRFDVLATSGPGVGFVEGPPSALGGALGTFHRLVRATGDRRGFSLGPIEPFVRWFSAAHAAGLAIFLEATVAEDDDRRGVVAGLLLYRQGDRLSTVVSGDEAAARAAHPGALHLLRWRAIQLAIREARAEMDLGGVDVAGARHEPRPGEPMYGLYQHKRSFGAVFVEQVGAHERVLRPGHFAIARMAARLAGGHST
jgi:lipid II:glycine glycyltransferase (peptidoglycan interpeptide bridge formation enzyme)